MAAELKKLFNEDTADNIEEKELAKRGYKVGSNLGSGSYAKVKLAYSFKHEKKVAMKIIDRKRASKDFLTVFLPREMEVLKHLKHPNLVELYEIMASSEKVYIVLELCTQGDLLEYIKLRGAMPEKDARHMFRQIVSGVDYLHTKMIVHRDLKCENLLLDKGNTVKITDFGFSRFISSVNDLSKTFCGSAAYAAPEVLNGTPYSPMAYDLWSLGVILYIMICGSMPYDDTNIKKMIKDQKVKKLSFSRAKHCSQQAIDTCLSCLTYEASKRATILTLRENKWLNALGKGASDNEE